MHGPPGTMLFASGSIGTVNKYDGISLTESVCVETSDQISRLNRRLPCLAHLA